MLYATSAKVVGCVTLSLTHHPPALAVSPQGAQVLAPLALYVPASLTGPPSAQVYPGTLKDFLPSLWRDNEGLIFALAVGAVVRLITPLLVNKATDPAVVVVDLPGKWALCLSGGHQGQGDRLTEWVAEQLGAEVILSGAGQALGYVPLDTLGLAQERRRLDGRQFSALSANNLVILRMASNPELLNALMNGYTECPIMQSHANAPETP
ncbi:MAG: hypothetical protein ACK5CA_05960 [Cyanobacteriota bacterium]